VNFYSKDLNDQMDVMEFFRQSAGRWRSQRTVHHLAFKQAEGGESEIQIAALAADHPDIVSLCELHQIDPALAVGGSCVTWQSAMQWDSDEEGGHEGKTVFALVPDIDNPHQGRLLRDRGYAEIVPVVGHYVLDNDGALNLLTDYETMSSKERFWFAGPNLRFRTSTVKRFGGFSTASFCTECRIEAETQPLNSTSATSNSSASSEDPWVGATLLGW
jgi:hypothetical protein